MTTIKIPTAFNIDLEFEAADMGRRFWAYIIDVAVRAAYAFIVGFSIDRLETVVDNPVITDMAGWVLVILPVVLYFPLTEITMRGQSIGKKLMNIKVVSLIGNEPSLSQHFIRWIFRLIESPLMMVWLVLLLSLQAYDVIPVALIITLAIVFMPLVVIGRSPLKQRLGDITAGTIVINAREKHSLNDTIFREISDTSYQASFPQILRLSDKDLNKVKELLDRSTKHNDHLLAARVAQRIKEVLNIETDLDPMTFLETLLNDYNYLVTRVKE